MKKLGKLGAVRERYADAWFGRLHWEREMFFRPVMRKRGR
jgi:hypothetical protein